MPRRLSLLFVLLALAPRAGADPATRPADGPALGARVRAACEKDWQYLFPNALHHTSRVQDVPAQFAAPPAGPEFSFFGYRFHTLPGAPNIMLHVQRDAGPYAVTAYAAHPAGTPDAPLAKWYLPSDPAARATQDVRPADDRSALTLLVVDGPHEVTDHLAIPANAATIRVERPQHDLPGLALFTTTTPTTRCDVTLHVQPTAGDPVDPRKSQLARTPLHDYNVRRLVRILTACGVAGDEARKAVAAELGALLKLSDEQLYLECARAEEDDLDRTADARAATRTALITLTLDAPAADGVPIRRLRLPDRTVYFKQWAETKTMYGIECFDRAGNFMWGGELKPVGADLAIADAWQVVLTLTATAQPTTGPAADRRPDATSPSTH